MNGGRSTRTFRAGNAVVNVLSLGSLVRAVRAKLVLREGGAVATLNLDHVVKLRQSVEFRSAYAAHDLVTADGFPIALAGRLQGVPVARATGSDMVVPLCRLAGELRARVAIVGSTPDSLAIACRRLMALCPGLRIVQAQSPALGFEPQGSEAHEIAEGLCDKGAELVFLALGAPKQEIFAAFARGIAPHACFVSVGAGIDFISGQQRRAPRPVRALKLEWAWRMAGNPARMLPRYINCAAVLPELLWSSFRNAH